MTVESGEPFLDGAHVGSVWGTTWHGIFENDGFRRAFLLQVAADAGRRWLPGDVAFAAVREARLDALGDLVEQHLDTDGDLAAHRRRHSRVAAADAPAPRASRSAVSR